MAATATAGKPAIVVDLKKGRIRINRATIRQLGGPEFVLLLVNPLDHTICMQPSIMGDTRAHRIRANALEGRNSIELYSLAFVAALRTMCPKWEADGKYRMPGDVIQEKSVAVFPMGDAVPIRGGGADADAG